MKTLLLLLLCAGLGIAAFNKSARVREFVRGTVCQPQQLVAMRDYQQGQRLFRAQWPGDPKAEFSAWMDDGNTNSHPLKSDWCAAFGKVSFTMLGTPLRHSWLVVFNRRTSEVMASVVGEEAAETIAQIQHGEYEQLAAAREARAVAQAATPRPGAWLWQRGRTMLDQGATPRRAEGERPGEGRRTWSQLPDGRWIEHDASVSAMRSIGGG